MEFVRTWALVICSAAIGCTLLLLLVPKNSLGKLFSVLASLFFLCCLITPFLSLTELPELSVKTTSSETEEELIQRVNEQMKMQIREAVETISRDVLSSYGYAAEKVEIRTDTSAEGYIYMNGVIVYVDNENAVHGIAIRTLLEQRLGVIVEVRSARG